MTCRRAPGRMFTVQYSICLPVSMGLACLLAASSRTSPEEIDSFTGSWAPLSFCGALIPLHWRGFVLLAPLLLPGGMASSLPFLINDLIPGID